jgi:hypothetical protein
MAFVNRFDCTVPRGAAVGEDAPEARAQGVQEQAASRCGDHPCTRKMQVDVLKLLSAALN